MSRTKSGASGSLRRHVKANDVAGIAALSTGIDALAIPTPQLVHRDSKVDLAITGNVLAVPALHLVKQRDRRADDVRALRSQQTAQPRIAHRRSPPITGAVAKIFGDRGTKRIAIEEGDRTTGGTQPIRQFPPQGCLAGTG